MTKNQLKGKLIERGYTVSAWAHRNDYKPRTVLQVIHRHVGTGSKHHGLVTDRILRDLSKTVGKPVVPDMPTETTTI